MAEIQEIPLDNTEEAANIEEIPEENHYKKWTSFLPPLFKINSGTIRTISKDLEKELMDSMKKAQEIAKQAEVVNKELMETQVTGGDPSGQVISTFNGLGVPQNLQVSANIASSGDADAISKACTQAMLDGHSKSQEQMMKRMQAMYGGAGLPAQ